MPKDQPPSTELTPEAERKLVEHNNALSKTPEAAEVVSIPVDELERVGIERLVPPKRGSWWVIPKAVADKELERE